MILAGAFCVVILGLVIALIYYARICINNDEKKYNTKLYL